MDASALGYARLALANLFFHVPAHLHSHIVERWRDAAEPTLDKFAPYAAFVLTIEVFFRIAVASNLIAAERVSNRADITYLFYLPFCMVFVSSDNLHRRCASLFMRPNQAELVKRLDAFRKQPTLDSADAANGDDEMMSIARSVRRKRGSWWQLPKDMPDHEDDD